MLRIFNSKDRKNIEGKWMVIVEVWNNGVQTHEYMMDATIKQPPMDKTELETFLLDHVNEAVEDYREKHPKHQNSQELVNRKIWKKLI